MAATRSRNAKRDRIAEVLRDASTDDVEIVVAYLAGGLRQRRTGVGWRTLQHAAEPAAEPSLTVAEVDAAFAAMAELNGPGSSTARADATETAATEPAATEPAALPRPRRDHARIPDTPEIEIPRTPSALTCFLPPDHGEVGVQATSCG